jgi:hypothetical protein
MVTVQFVGRLLTAVRRRTRLCDFGRERRFISVYLGVSDGPGIGETIAHVVIGAAVGELIEYVAEI